MRFALQAVAEQPDRESDQRNQRCQAEIALPDRLAFRLAIGLEVGAGQLVGADRGQAAKDERRPDDRENGGAERIERLREGQPAVRGAGRAEQADQRVRDDLDDHHTAGEDEQREQEDRIGRRLAGRDEQQAARHHGEQARDRAAHVADLLDQFRARYADDRIGGEEAELDQHRLGPVEREQFLQLGDDHVVERRDAAEDEKQAEYEILQARCVDWGPVVLD